jgi:hypothetical protein
MCLKYQTKTKKAAWDNKHYQKNPLIPHEFVSGSLASVGRMSEARCGKVCPRISLTLIRATKHKAYKNPARYPGPGEAHYSTIPE